MLWLWKSTYSARTIPDCLVRAKRKEPLKKKKKRDCKTALTLTGHLYRHAAPHVHMEKTIDQQVDLHERKRGQPLGEKPHIGGCPLGDGTRQLELVV
jgi:hypothetical protein